MGISRHGEYLVMGFVESDGTVGGYQLKAFYELLKLGLDYKLGIKYSDPNTRAVYLLAKEYNLELVGKYLVADYQTLAEAVGDI